MIKKIAKGTLSLCVLLSFLFITSFSGACAQIPDFSDLSAQCKPQENRTLCLGGDLFGLRMNTKGLLVTKIDVVETENGTLSPGKTAGLQKGDVILKADEVELDSAASFSKLLSHSGEKGISLLISRDKKELTVNLTPAKAADQSGYKAGIWVRDGAAGIGTVTFFDKNTGEFAGLGHPVCDGETGLAFPLGTGTVCHAGIQNIEKGLEGAPGGIAGKLCKDHLGTLCANLPSGVYGLVSPDAFSGEEIETAPKSAVTTGKASIFCTLSEEGKKEYEIEIEEIVNQNRESKNFILRITDPELIEKTGGIIQGMSGSPIVQNGHLVGAVTHVLVGNPTRGYGIFIENMLKNVP